MYIHIWLYIYTQGVCVCVCMGICVYIWGLEVGSLIVETITRAYTHMEGDWLISSPLHLPGTHFCFSVEGRPDTTTATVMWTRAAFTCPLSADRSALGRAPQWSSIRVSHLGNLQKTHAQPPSLTGLNSDFSVCSQASHLPQPHLPASALQHIWLMDCLIYIYLASSLATLLSGMPIVWLRGFLIYLLIGSAPKVSRS